MLTDLKMPGMDGLQLLAKLRETDADLPVIVMTAFGEVETAVRAMRSGARDYLAKPVNVGELSVVVARELEQRRLRAETGLLRARLSEKYSFENIIGSSAPMQAVFKTVAQIAPSRASVLITGESGTGKELIAAAIHERSPRAKGPFVKLHCAALAESHPGERALRARARLVHRAPRPGATAGSSRPTTGRCSSTRSARSRRPCR